MKKMHKFLDKVVDVVDAMLYDIGLGDNVTVKWKYRKHIVSLKHDEYGLIGEWDVKRSFEEFGRLKNHYPDMKKSVYIQETIGCAIIAEVREFVQEKRSAAECECNRNYYDELEVEESRQDFCNGNCDECYHSDTCESSDFSNVEDFDIEELEDMNDEEYEDEMVETEEVENKGETFMTTPENRQTMEPLFEENSGVVACPNCGSTSIRKNGKKRGIQQYICKDCCRYFSENTAAS